MGINPNRRRAAMKQYHREIVILSDRLRSAKSPDIAATMHQQGRALSCRANALADTPVDYHDVLDVTMIG